MLFATVLLLFNLFAHPDNYLLEIYKLILFVFFPILLIYFSIKDDVRRLISKIKRGKKRQHVVIEISPPRGKRKKRRVTKYAPAWMRSIGNAGRSALKELGIGYGKANKEKQNKKEIVVRYIGRDDRTEELLRAKWQPYIEMLEEKGEVYVSRNHHHGKLRGKDILRAMYRDLRRLGYNVVLEMDDYDGKIKLRK